jgi:hypothetical protein
MRLDNDAFPAGVPGGSRTAVDSELDSVVTAALAAYPREPLPAQFVGRVMAEVVRSPHPLGPHAMAAPAGRTGAGVRPPRLLAIDLAVPAGVALLTLSLVASVAWLEVIDPTALPRAARWASDVSTLVMPGLATSGLATTALATSVAGLAALALALVTERHRPSLRVR